MDGWMGGWMEMECRMEIKPALDLYVLKCIYGIMISLWFERIYFRYVWHFRLIKRCICITSNFFLLLGIRGEGGTPIRGNGRHPIVYIIQNTSSYEKNARILFYPGIIRKVSFSEKATSEGRSIDMRDVCRCRQTIPS